MKHKQFSSETLFGSALIAIVLVWIAFTGFSSWVFWMIIPLAILALCRLKCKEHTRLLLDAGAISIAAGVLVFVLLSFLLPDVFMPWGVIALIATVPAGVVAATVFFYFTRPVSKHERIHELEALSFVVLVFVALAFVLPQLFVAATLPADYAFSSAAQQYFFSEELSERQLSNLSTVPETLMEYAQGYRDELSALAVFWLRDPPGRCIDCIATSYTALSEPGVGSVVFATAAAQLDAYLLLLDSDPELFAELESCVADSPIIEYSAPSFDRPSQIPWYSETVAGDAFGRYVVSSDYYATGFVPVQAFSEANVDIRERVVSIARQVAVTEQDVRAINLVEDQYLRSATNCGVFY